ncbi:rho guanine nucleotide exchange factor 16-like [Brienomyrus brachyistius]|uniref:rho guanine nucleotide exchange factor 16-like n=1 Tax=Brienomyrus brachyistius TaxID=42636 RepID=UPI0020B1BF64|nr:rho guanine nucleotide exchange factor 16-like [Brienomyrus brachyistius]
MSNRQLDGARSRLMGEPRSATLEHRMSALQLDGHSNLGGSLEDLPHPADARDELSRRGVVLSTQSKAAQKIGKEQIIPRNLAVSSRPKARHHTTVVTLPASLGGQKDKRPSVPGLQLSWEDYDSEGDGGSLNRNRRNKSYRAAVDFLTGGQTPADLDALALNPPTKEPPRRGPQRSKRTIGWKRNQKIRSSFKDEPRLYQEIRERGLTSNNQSADDELLDDAQAEPPEPDRSIVVQSYRPAHITWGQLPQVKETGILQNISASERKRQEAIFEIITSEYSYLHSLNILVRHFRTSKDLHDTMTATEHHHLFSNILDIQAASHRFFDDLERRHRENPLIRDISDIIHDHAANHFQPYINYCANEIFQQRALQKLLSTSGPFKEVLKQIEMKPECGGLPMLSFLILPMQRVTRLPLLMDTIWQKTPKDTAEYFAAEWALKAISKLVKKCNDGARTMERTEQMYTIQRQLDFGKIKPFPLISVSRWLLKRGEVATCFLDVSIWKAFSTKSYYLFLFNDVLIVTRKKSEETYVVMDYAMLENLEVEAAQWEGQSSPSLKQGGSSPYPLKILMKKNSEGREEQMLLAAESLLDRDRWVAALQHNKNTDGVPNKEDLPQYEVTKAYLPRESDELGLQQAEVVVMLQARGDWYRGERMRDGERGWFPASCVTAITNRAAVANNLRRMERLRKETNV